MAYSLDDYYRLIPALIWTYVLIVYAVLMIGATVIMFVISPRETIEEIKEAWRFSI